MSTRRLLPNTHPTIAQREVIESIGESGKYRNPFRVDLKSGFPKERDERQKEYGHLKSMETELVRKGRPL